MAAPERTKQELESAGFGTGLYDGPEANRVLGLAANVYLLSVTEHLAELDPIPLRQTLLRLWGDAEQMAEDIIRSEGDVEAQAQYFGAHLGAASRTDEIRLLLELTLRAAQNGRRPASGDVLVQLLHATACVAEARRLRSFAAEDLLAVEVQVRADGTLAVAAIDSPTFRGRDFILDREKTFLTDLRLAEEPLAVELARMSAGGELIPAELGAIDQAVLGAFGCSLRALLRTAFILEAMARDEERQHRPVAVCSLTAVLRALEQQLSEYAPRELMAALRLLVPNRGSLDSSDFDPDKFRERVFRLGCRPIVPLPSSDSPDRVGWAAAAVSATIQDFAVSVVNGVWPFWLCRDDRSQAALHDELKRRREAPTRGRSFHLERLVQQRVSSHQGILTRRNLDPRDRSRSGDRHGLNLRKEIDVLAVDQVTKVIWVLSVKDHSLSLAPGRIRNICTLFLGDGKNSYVGALATMVEDIASQAEQAAVLCGARNRERWAVRGAFVTRIVCPATYVVDRDPIFPFYRLSTVDGIRG